MFAGPNGSGKSSIQSVIGRELLGVYINPDDIEKSIRERDMLDLRAYGVNTTADEILPFFLNSTLLIKAGLIDEAAELRFFEGRLSFFAVMVNSYFASVAADFIRHKLLESRTSFTFETVMSSPDKVRFLAKAKAKGFRIYLYFVATEDPQINISRVRHRVKMGGHDVPEDKIISRYQRSLTLLMDAVRLSDRAYIFDNTSHEQIWLAEVTDGRMLEMKSAQMPQWFKLALWDKFVARVI
ncbi:MAG: zeta toxin family protein [Gallionella sp.]